MSVVYHSIYIASEHSQFTLYYARFIIVGYVSEHQLPYAVNTSHTTPTTRVNWDLMLLKLIGEDIVYVFSGFFTYIEPRPRCLALNQALLLGSQ